MFRIEHYIAGAIGPWLFAAACAHGGGAQATWRADALEVTPAIAFEAGSEALTAEARRALPTVVRRLLETPERAVELVVTGASADKRLLVPRAEALAKQLVAHGLLRARLTSRTSEVADLDPVSIRRGAALVGLPVQADQPNDKKFDLTAEVLRGMLDSMPGQRPRGGAARRQPEACHVLDRRPALDTKLGAFGPYLGCTTDRDGALRCELGDGYFDGPSSAWFYQELSVCSGPDGSGALREARLRAIDDDRFEGELVLARGDRTLRASVRMEPSLAHPLVLISEVAARR